ncbi:MAG: hypothetical protein IJ104_00665 [Methanobrevibacter sp.]|nr:hypothetical protein [Methanobrevibacter sp.]MBQ9024881.1 hypothetical protein [Methanobrevibacter sp.]
MTKIAEVEPAPTFTKEEKLEKLIIAKNKKIETLEKTITNLKELNKELDKKDKKRNDELTRIMNYNTNLKARNEELHKVLEIIIHEITTKEVMVINNDDD